MIDGLSPDFERILEAGNNAPSGENCQPWHFVVRGDAVEVRLLPERDQSAYSWGQRASYFAVGAAIENMLIAATAEGYRTTIAYFPELSDEWHVADIRFIKDANIVPDPLATQVMNRTTNRKPYAKDALSADERAALFLAAKQSNGHLFLAEERAAVDRLGRIGAINEEVMLANHFLHEFFFDHVSWTQEEDERKKVGFYIKTLELPPPAEAMFKVFRHWSIMRVLSAIGFNRVVAGINAKQNAAASAIGAITVAGTDPLDFVQAGRATERVWVTATSVGLSFQPLSGILFFKLKIDAGEDAIFSPGARELITGACQEIAQIFKTGGEPIAFVFRLGHGGQPTARAARFPLEEVATLYL